MPHSPMWQRFAAQLLTDRSGRSVGEVVGRILAVQAQDRRGARLAVRARSRGLTAADVDRALTDERSVVVGDLNRGTQHLVLAEDYWWLHALTTPQLRTGIGRRLTEEGVTPSAAARAQRLIAREVSDGPRTRSQLRGALDAAGIATSPQGLYHLLRLSCAQGTAVRGPTHDGEQAFVDARSWLGEPPRLDRGQALARLAERYLAGHGPATDRDLARWAGIPLRDARAGLAAIADRTVATAAGAVLPRGTPPATSAPAPVLLGAFEPVLLGWTSREEVLGRHSEDVVSGGVFRAFALVAGRAAGRWRIERGRARLAPFDAWDEDVTLALEQDAADVERFLA